MNLSHVKSYRINLSGTYQKVYLPIFKRLNLIYGRKCNMVSISLISHKLTKKFYIFTLTKRFSQCIFPTNDNFFYLCNYLSKKTSINYIISRIERIQPKIYGQPHSNQILYSIQPNIFLNLKICNMSRNIYSH